MEDWLKCQISPLVKTKTKYVVNYKIQNTKSNVDYILNTIHKVNHNVGTESFLPGLKLLT